MNNIKFNQTGGFPLDTNLLDFMQNSYQLLNVLGEMAGNLSILKGCQQTGSVVSSGIVYIEGEVLPFKGGVKGGKVVIKTDKTSLQFENGENYEVEEVRYAAFGVSSTSFNWNDFKRIEPLIALMQRITVLEQKTNFIKVGTIMIWEGLKKNIPNGWVIIKKAENRTLRAVSSDDKLKSTGGSDRVIITENQMPAHKHNISIETAGNHSHSFKDIYLADEAAGHLDPAKTIVKADGYGLSAKVQASGNKYTQYHQHSTETSGGHSHSADCGRSGNGAEIDITNSYYGVYFIKYIGVDSNGNTLIE